jgi:hypothetical protein
MQFQLLLVADSCILSATLRPFLICLLLVVLGVAIHLIIKSLMQAIASMSGTPCPARAIHLTRPYPRLSHVQSAGLANACGKVLCTASTHASLS